MGYKIPKNPKVAHNKYHGSTRTLGLLGAPTRPCPLTNTFGQNPHP